MEGCQVPAAGRSHSNILNLLDTIADSGQWGALKKINQDRAPGKGNMGFRGKNRLGPAKPAVPNSRTSGETFDSRREKMIFFIYTLAITGSCPYA